MAATKLPLPHLASCEVSSIPVLTDEALLSACGVRIAFTTRAGGVSESVYESLNLGGQVGDDPRSVEQNRSLLVSAFKAESLPLIVPRQVHGTHMVEVLSTQSAPLAQAREAALEGADGVVAGVSGVAILLCFADCAPLIVVSPSGRFAVAHAGWRGAVAHVAAQTVASLAACDAYLGQDQDAPEVVPTISEYNAYIGPCIHAECFECGVDVCERFVQQFGVSVVTDQSHVDLPAAVAVDLMQAGLSSERICTSEACTACAPDVWFSYRASGGTCGRHAAFAFKNEEVIEYGN